MHVQHPSAGSRAFQCFLLSILFICRLGFVEATAAESAKRSYNLPTDMAEKTLKLYSEQSGRALLAGTTEVSGIRTNAVRGEFTAREAIDRMLANTGLVAAEDPLNGAFVVTREATLPNAPRAAPAPSRDRPQGNQTDKGDAVQLTPFVVSVAGDQGYRAAGTLSGTRMNTTLFETPAAISVLTKELLDDLGVEKINDFLAFTTSADPDLNTDTLGGRNQANDAAARIRGFGTASVTRNYFPIGPLDADRYNVERVDLNRGPNAVLYGIGSPGGAVNTSSKHALLNGAQKSVSTTLGSWNKKRAELDLAFPLVKDRLALRVNALVEDKQGWFDFEFRESKGLAVSSTYQPFKNSVIRAEVERMVRDQLVPRVFPPGDAGGTTWFANGAPLSGDPLLPGTNPNVTLLRTVTQLPVFWVPQVRAAPFRLGTTGADMRPDLPGNQAAGYWQTRPGLEGPVSGTLQAPYMGTVIPWNAAVYGPGNRTPSDFTVLSLYLEQRVGPLFVELAWNRRTYFRDYRQYSGTDVIGDPNIVLPGAYFADGDSAVGVGRNPGTLLPDIGRANPYAGSMYVEGFKAQQQFDQHADHFRCSLAYQLDLERRNQWLGKHTVAALFQGEYSWAENIFYREYNAGPGNSQLIDSATNQILRRTYLSFNTPNGARGAIDPWSDPIPESPGVKPAMLLNAPYPATMTKSESDMVVAHNRFLNERLVFTAGRRRDILVTNTAVSGGERVPNSTNLWWSEHDLFDPSKEKRFVGYTGTFGMFVAPLRWMGLTYNQSNSVQPQDLLSVFNQQQGVRSGEGRDYGIRLNLLGNRLYVSVNSYTNTDLNANIQGASTPRTAALPALNSIARTQLILGRPLPKSMTDAGIDQLYSGGFETGDLSGRGTEIEVTGEIAKGWSVMMNFSHNKLTATNTAPDMNGFLREVKGSWSGNPTLLSETLGSVATYVRQRDNTPDRDFNQKPATFNDAYEYAVSVMDAVNRREGQTPFGHNEDAFNFFISHRFAPDAPSVLKRSRIGFGGNWRSASVIGYDLANNNAPIMGDSFFIGKLMLGKRIPLPNGQSIDLQLNIDNLFAEQDMLPFAATAPGEVVRYRYPRSRQSWELRAQYSF